MKKKIGYLGPVGSFSEEACFELWPQSPENTYQLFPSLEAIYQALVNQKIDIAVMPTWNSSLGLLNNVQNQPYFSHLENNLNVHCLSFLEKSLNFCLLVHLGASLEMIKTLHINPYAKTIAKQWLSNYPNLEIITHNSSSEAADAAQKMGPQHGALAGAQAAKIYGLEVLLKNIAISTMRFSSLKLHLLSRG